MCQAYPDSMAGRWLTRHIPYIGCFGAWSRQMAFWALDGASNLAVWCDLTPAALDSRRTDVTASVFVDGILHGHGNCTPRLVRCC